jgi:hypothetical protein
MFRAGPTSGLQCKTAVPEKMRERQASKSGYEKKSFTNFL